MALRFGVPLQRTATDLENLPDDVKVAFNATPSHLHLPTTLAMPRRGINVFLEKPLGETAAAAVKIISNNGKFRVVGVNQYRRLVPSFWAGTKRIERGDLGQIKRVNWNEGNKFGCPARWPFSKVL